MPPTIEFPTRDKIPPFYGVDEARMVSGYKVSIYKCISAWYYLDILGESDHFTVKAVPANRIGAGHEPDGRMLLHYFSRIVPPTENIIKAYDDAYDPGDTIKYCVDYLRANALTEVTDLYATRILTVNKHSNEFKIRYTDSPRDKRCKSDILLGIIGIQGRQLKEFKDAIRSTLEHCHCTDALTTFNSLVDNESIHDVVMSSYVNRQILAEVNACCMAHKRAAEIFALRVEYKENPDYYYEYNPLYPPLVAEHNPQYDVISSYAAYLLARCEDINFKNPTINKTSYEEDFEL